MPADTRPETAEEAAARAPAPTRQRAIVPFEQIVDQVTERRQWITEVLPATVDTDRFINLALYAISKQPNLNRCTVDSLIRGLRESASLGLEIGSSLGQATLLPFWNSDLRSYEAVFIPMYQGLLDLMYRSGEVLDAEARVVYDCDEFEYIPSADQPVRHRPALTRPPTAQRLGAYFLAHLRGGGRVSEWMNAAEIEAIRKRSRAATANSGPWVTDTDLMWRKTPTRRASKYMPKSADLRRAISIEDEAEARYAPPPTPHQVAGPDARARLLSALLPGEEGASPREGQDGAADAQTTDDTAAPTEAQDPAEALPEQAEGTQATEDADAED